MKIASSRIVYDPLSITFDVTVTGGTTSQKYDSATREYDPDRSITPLVLIPSLWVTDPDGVITPGDKSGSLVNHRWYEDIEQEANRITGNSDYTLNAHGALAVRKNIAPDNPVKLIYTAQYLDTRRNEVIKLRKEIPLTCDITCELALSVVIDAAPKSPLSVYKQTNTRVINAQLLNGSAQVGDSDAAYVWHVLDEGIWRVIVDEDLFYITGQNTKSLIVDKRYIDRELIRVVANLVNVPGEVAKAQTKMYRYYGQYEENIHIVRGAVIRPDTTEIEARVTISNRQGLIDNPKRLFNIGIYFKPTPSTLQWQCKALGDNIVCDASIAGSTYGNRPLFGCEVNERTALRSLAVNGVILTINSAIVCAQIPK